MRFENDLNAFQITYHLAAGAIIHGFTLHLVKGNYTMLQTSFNISNECGLKPLLQSCAVNKSIKLPQQGNFTLLVLGWEQNKGIISNVYFQEFAIVNEISSINAYTDTTAPSSTNTDNSIMEFESTYTQSANLIISGEIW